MTSIIITSILFFIAVSTRRDISLIFNRIGFSLGLGNVGWAMIMLLLLTLFILNDDISLQLLRSLSKGGLLYKTNIKLHWTSSYETNNRWGARFLDLASRKETN